MSTLTLEKLHMFWHKSLSREEFYEVYGVMTALAGPACGDYVQVGELFLNLKRIVRIMRITVMGWRFRVDYAEPYTPETIEQELRHLRHVYRSIVSKEEREAVVKVIKALETIESWLS